MTSTIINRNLPLLLSQLRESIISHFRPILNFFGLTEQQWRIMRVLAEGVNIEPKDLCQTCQILSPSMAGILKRLEEMDLIQRATVLHDKRRISVSLTGKGQKLFVKMTPLVQQQYKLLQEAYSEEVIANLYKSLDDFMLIKDTTVKHIELPKRINN